jgi:hypothetical protein
MQFPKVKPGEEAIIKFLLKKWSSELPLGLNTSGMDLRLKIP